MYESTLSKGELSTTMGEDGKVGERFLEMIMNLHFGIKLKKIIISLRTIVSVLAETVQQRFI